MPQKTFEPIESLFRPPHCNWETYLKKYQFSIENPDAFWKEKSTRLQWMKPFSKVRSTQFKKPVQIRWFEDGQLNIAANCLDRHLPRAKNRAAIIWEPDHPAQLKKILTYGELHREVCKLSNTLTAMGVKRGDRVTIYLPMIPETAISMLACVRIGAIHSVVFGGFSADSVADRIQDCKSDFVITADEGLRGGKRIPLKATVDEALKKCPQVKKVLVVKRTGGDIPWNPKRDFWFHEQMEKASERHDPVPLNAEDPSFILYTSGSTNKPKGVVHTTAGYLLHAALTHHYIFDLHFDDIYFCTADLGWITGHSYVLYGPLANCATTVMFEGTPTYPDPSRLWEIVDQYLVSILYTAPTAIRALMREGNSFVTKTSRRSLRILGSVGEPINPEAWLWYHEVVGKKRCPIMDTWWQTETGGILISPLPGATTLKPGSATLPFFGIEPAIVDGDGNELTGACEGNLVIKNSWPGQARTIYEDHARFEETYFSSYPGYYFTGDGCRRDEDGYYWITGRVDDVINVAGHRLGTAEIESALVGHKHVAESAVVGFPHDLKGQGIYAFVTLKNEITPTDDLKRELIQWVRKEIGPIATPDIIQWAPGLPKTRSGKIMRRILRKIAENQHDNLGDTTTLADPSVVQNIIQGRKDLA